MELLAFQGEEQLGRWRVFSVGGGKIEIEGQPSVAPQDVYPLSTFQEIKEYCQREGKFLWQYVEENEGPEIWDYLRDVWKQMKATVYAGLNTEGVLHGGLGVQRKAKYLVRQRHMDESPETRENRKVCAYAFAVSEENAGGGVVVTAPTCGASGVLPAVLVFKQEQLGFSDRDMLHALAAAGIVGISSRQTPPSLGRSAAARRRLAAPAPWRRRAWRSCTTWTWTKSSTLPRWPWSTTWA